MSLLDNVIVPIQIIDVANNLIPEVAQVHMAAFKNSVNIKLGLGYVEDMIEWFSQLEQGVALCAVKDNRDVLGYVVGAPVGYVKQYNRNLFFSATKAISRNLQLFCDDSFKIAFKIRLRSTFQRRSSHRQPQLPEPTLSLVGIGVLPSFQGMGIGEALMLTFEKKAFERGNRSMRLSVVPTNLSARRLYEKMDWSPYLDTDEPNVVIYYYKIL